MESCHPQLNKDDTVTLHDANGKRTGDFYVRGGICWPVMMVDYETGEDDYRGYAIVGAVDTEKNVLHIVAEMVYATVKHVYAPGTNILAQKGLGPWFASMWVKCFARAYYWNQDRELNRRFMLDVIRDRTIEPKPYFVEIDWSSHSDAKQMIWQYLKEKRIVFYESGGFSLAEQLKNEKRDDLDRLVYPGTQALQCLIAGLERHPYRKRRGYEPGQLEAAYY